MQVALVSKEDLLTEFDAAEMMGRRRLVVVCYVSRGFLVPAAAVASSGTGLIEGVTRSSVERQIEWRDSANWFQKLWRVLGWPFLYV